VTTDHIGGAVAGDTEGGFGRGLRWWRMQRMTNNELGVVSMLKRHRALLLKEE
jgi:hypothetical protein